jgi:hypothetical protein
MANAPDISRRRDRLNMVSSNIFSKNGFAPPQHYGAGHLATSDGMVNKAPSPQLVEHAMRSCGAGRPAGIFRPWPTIRCAPISMTARSVP